MKEMKMNLDGELEEVIWKPIKGYEGIYVINQFGDVKSLARTLKSSHGRVRQVREFMKSSTVHAKHKNLSMSLIKDGHTRVVMTARLVAEAFLGLDRTDKRLIVYNKDLNKLDLYYKHLIITDSTNIRASIPKDKLSLLPRATPVQCVTKDGEIFKFDAMTTAANYFGITRYEIKIKLDTNGKDQLGNLWHSYKPSVK